ATDLNNRKVWVVEANTCSGTCAVTPTVFENIPGMGNEPTISTSSVSVDGRGYVIVSHSNPPGLVEYRDGQWREVPVFLSPSLGSLGTDGKQLWVMSLDGGGSVERRAFSPGDDGGSYSPVERMGTTLNAVSSAELAFTPMGKAFTFVTNNNLVEQFEFTTPFWNQPSPLFAFPAQAGATKVVMLGETTREALGFTRISDGTVQAAAFNPLSMQASFISLGPSMASATVSEFDVARFGNGALLAFSSSTQQIQLVLVSLAPSGVVASDVTLGDGGLFFNSNPARWPRLAVDGPQVYLSWQEEVAAGAQGMAGTIIR
ncbi:MAG: hypothetical protein Q8L14_30085, partial [Myxococcales bacterium]|nr:hypothetical protein [Myxococcales bacterium]